MTARGILRFFEGRSAVSIAVLEGAPDAIGAVDSSGLFTPTERMAIASCAAPARRTATTLAGKAAVLAALGSPCTAPEFYPHMEVSRDHYGVPRFALRAACPVAAPKLATSHPHISLSQDGSRTLACAVIPLESRTALLPRDDPPGESIATTLRHMLADVLHTGEARRMAMGVDVRTVRGAGVDIVAVDRVSAIVEQQADVLPGLFTRAERAEAEAAGAGAGCASTHLALVFAAKEAVFKTLRSAWPDDSGLLAIEVLGLAEGAPHVMLKGGMATLARSRGVDRFVTAVTPHEACGAAIALALC